MRVSSVRAFGVQVDVEFHASGHHRLDTDRQLARRIVRVVVRADHRVEIVHHTGIDDGFGATAGFFRRLEHDVEAAVDPVAVGGEPFDRTEQAGHMDVMPAGVHHAGIVRSEIQAAFLGDRQAVDVGTQADTRTIMVSLNQADDTRLQRGVQHFHAE